MSAMKKQTIRRSAPVRGRVVPALLRHINARRVMELLWQKGSLSRADLVRLTDISAPTMSRLVDGLLRGGLVETMQTDYVGLGRPAVVYRPAVTSVQVIGVIIGIRECRVVSTGLDGVINPGRTRTCLSPRTYEGMIAALAKTILEVRDITRAKCLGVGLSVPGLVSRDEQRMEFSPNLHFLDKRALGSDLEAAVGVPVLLQQEEHGFCLSERLFGAARGAEHFAVVDISDGLGMGVVSGGRLIAGARGFGGELGHITVDPTGEPCGCGNRGCLETVVTDLAFAKRISRRVGRTLEIEEAVEVVRSGRVAADDDIRQMLDALAVGIGVVVNLFNPEVVLVNGRMLDAGDGMVEQLAARVRHHALGPSCDGCRFERARTTKLLGAVAAVMDRLCGQSGF